MELCGFCSGAHLSRVAYDSIECCTCCNRIDYVDRMCPGRKICTDRGGKELRHTWELFLGLEESWRDDPGRQRSLPLLPLYPGRTRRTGSRFAEDPLRRLSPHHRVGRGIRLLLVGVISLTDTTFELNTLLLLDDVSRLVSRGVKVRRLREGNLVAHGVGRCTKFLGRHGGIPAHMCLDIANFASAKRLLDLLGMWQRTALATCALGSKLPRVGRTRCK